MIRVLTLLGLLAAGVGGCSVAGRVGDSMVDSVNDLGTWAADRMAGSSDPDNPTELEDIVPSLEFSIAWKKGLSDGIGRGYPLIQPAVGENHLYVANADRDSITALELDTRKKLWRQRLPDRISGGLGLGEGLVLAGTTSAKVVALDAETGEIVWTGNVSSEVLAAPVAARGVVVISTGDGKLYGLEAATGAHKWMVEREVPVLSLRGASMPAVAEGLALQGFADGHLMALEIDNGVTAWDTAVATPRGRTELDRVIDSDANLHVSDGVIYAAAYQGRVTAIGLNSGEILWAREISTHQDLAVDTFNLYVTTPDGTVIALDRRTGNTYWMQEGLNNRRVTAPVSFGGFVAVGDFEGYLHWLDPDTGDFVARRRVSRKRLLRPVPLPGQLLVRDTHGKAVGITIGDAE